MKEEIAAAAKASPAIGGAAYVAAAPDPAIYAGLTLNEWVAAVTIVYVLAQTGLLVPKWAAMLRDAVRRGGYAK